MASSVTANRIKRAAKRLGLEYRDDYSGRCMYGARCAAIVGPASAVQAIKIPGKRVDNMGLDLVAYWPEARTDAEEVAAQPS